MSLTEFASLTGIRPFFCRILMQAAISGGFDAVFYKCGNVCTVKMHLPMPGREKTKSLAKENLHEKSPPYLPGYSLLKVEALAAAFDDRQ